MVYQNTYDFAKAADADDPLSILRREFTFPDAPAGKETLYFCGNSLGIQPKRSVKYVQQTLQDWAKLGVKGHFEGEGRFADYYKKLQPTLAMLVGARVHEVTAMSTLSVNLHLMMATFYQPKGKRTKILMEAGAFPSDQYAVESQVKWHGLNPEEAIVEVSPETGKFYLETEAILDAITLAGEELALVMFSGVNYYTGQVFDMEAIVQAARKVGAYVGFDLAHAMGNVPVELHDWDADFAVWCTYKYLNSGPGAVAGLFVHEKHAQAVELPRLAGWWGYDEKTRFNMEKGFKPMYGAEGWQLSNENILSLASMRGSLELFAEVGMDAIRQKSERLTGYLEYILEDIDFLSIVTPRHARGAQLSVKAREDIGRHFFEYLISEGVFCDWREPGITRLAPAPLYNSFADVWKLGQLLESYRERFVGK
jgi:kynureninase